MTHVRKLPFLMGLVLAAAVSFGMPHGLLATAGVTHAPPQRTPQQPSASPPSLSAPPDGPNDPFRAGMEARRVKMQNDERHKRLVADTEKLLALSNELKQDVEKASKNEMSLDVIRKAAEIEKLAKDVKERMRS